MNQNHRDPANQTHIPPPHLQRAAGQGLAEGRLLARFA
jgi:hypothetical protein